MYRSRRVKFRAVLYTDTTFKEFVFSDWRVWGLATIRKPTTLG